MRATLAGSSGSSRMSRLRGIDLRHGAKAAAARAAVAEDHEGRRAAMEALVDIRAARRFADGVQIELRAARASAGSAIRNGCGSCAPTRAAADGAAAADCRSEPANRSRFYRNGIREARVPARSWPCPGLGVVVRAHQHARSGLSAGAEDRRGSPCPSGCVRDHLGVRLSDRDHLPEGSGGTGKARRATGGASGWPGFGRSGSRAWAAAAAWWRRVGAGGCWAAAVGAGAGLRSAARAPAATPAGVNRRRCSTVDAERLRDRSCRSAASSVRPRTPSRTPPRTAAPR